MARRELKGDLDTKFSILAWSINNNAERLLRDQLDILKHFERNGLDEATRTKAKTHGIEYALLGDLPSLVRSVDFMLFQRNKELLLTVVGKVCLIELNAKEQISRPAESFAREHMRKGSSISSKQQNRTAAGKRTATI